MNNRKRVPRPRVRALALSAFILAGAVAIFGGSAGSAAWQSGRRAANPPPPSAPIHAPDENPPPPVRINMTPSPAVTLAALPDEIMTEQLQALDGRTFRLADYRGRVLILNLWATWCGPCRQEIPHFNELRRQYPESRLQIVGLTTERPETHTQTVQQFARRLDIKYRLGWAERPFAEALMRDRRVIPQTYVIGPNGQIVERLVGFSANRTPQALRAAVERALLEIE